MRDEQDSAGATRDRAREGYHEDMPLSEAAGGEVVPAATDAADWRAMVAARTAAVRRSVAAMPRMRPLPPR
jgi:hypothetical protein